MYPGFVERLKKDITALVLYCPPRMQVCCSSREEILYVDCRIHTGFPSELPEHVGFQAEILRIWTFRCPDEVCLDVQCTVKILFFSIPNSPVFIS